MTGGQFGQIGADGGLQAAGQLCRVARVLADAVAGGLESVEEGDQRGGHIEQGRGGSIALTGGIVVDHQGQFLFAIGRMTQAREPAGKGGESFEAVGHSADLGATHTAEDYGSHCAVHLGQ